MTLDIARTYCRWAEAKYGLADVQEVTFEPGAHGPYSDVTPDLDLHMRVEVRTADGRRHDFEVTYATGLITEILQFAVGEPASRS